MKSLNTRMLVLLLALAVLGLIGTDSAIAQNNAIAPEIIYYDYIDANGVLKGGVIKVDPTNPKHTVVEGAMAAALPEDAVVGVETIIDNGPIGNRLDLAILGDGYTEPNLGVYANDVANLVTGFFAESPFDEYASFFNVHRVDIKSEVSGIENCNGEQGRTPLEMCFGGVENRVLYINVGNAKEAANHDDVPDWDHILALANTDRYGGTGYFADKITTASGHEEEGWTKDIALHEFGHAFTNLEDEYFDDTNGVEYPYDESTLDGIANLSTYDANGMNDANEKWYLWLGEPTVPDVNRIGTYVGGMRDYNEGIYRPTEWSKMRRVDYAFYQVNVEQFIFKIYEIVEAVDYATPEGTYTLGTQFFVEPLQPATHSLDVQWYLDGDAIPGATDTEFNSSTLDKPTGEYELKVEVVDKTEMVKDEDNRPKWERTWTLGEAAHWKLDEGTGDIAYDSIGSNNGRLGAQVGADPCDPNWVNDPNRGWCLDFDGDDDYVSLSDMNALANNTTTIAAWIKADDLSEVYNPIVTQCKEVGGYYYGYSFYVDGDVNKPTFYLGGDLAQSIEAINEGQWYHIAGTYDGSTLKIYVNGVQRGTKISSKSGTHHNAYIGYDDVIGADFFSGLIDDVRVYDWAMDQAQIWEIMSAGASKFCVKDNYRVLMAWFDDSGNLFLRGSLTQNTTPSAKDNIDEFRFQDSNGVDIAIIDANSANMYIKRSLSENQTTLDPQGDNNFIIKDSSGDEVAYIDDPNGDLYLKGKLYQNPE